MVVSMGADEGERLSADVRERWSEMEIILKDRP